MHVSMLFHVLAIELEDTNLTSHRQHEYKINANIHIYEKQIATTHPIHSLTPYLVLTRSNSQS
jgi:hypothetical protein